MEKLINISWTGKIAFFTLGLLLLILVIAPPAHAKINVVATIKPVHSLVAGVMRGAGSPHLLLEAGSPHTYALKPSNAKALQQADLVIWIGPDLEQFLTEPLKSLASKADIVVLQKAGGLIHHPARGENHAHEHDETDPHIWLDPINAGAFVKAIKTALIKNDPANAALYKKNAAALLDKLDKLTSDLEAKLSPLRDKPFLTFHDAYQYFEKRFTLKYAGSLAINPEQQPGARHLKNMRQKIRTLGIKCVFAEPQFKAKLIDLVVERTNARTDTLDPIGASIKKGPELYFSLLRNNARAFISCLGGVKPH